MKQWFVYLLRCQDNTLYCGMTNNIVNRVKKHNLGKGAKYTSSRRPCHLIYIETVATRSEALKREYKIKQMTREEKEGLIKGS